MTIDKEEINAPQQISNFEVLTREISEILTEAENLYKMECKPNCVSCCREPIGLTSVEFSVMRRHATPVNTGFGCPFRSSTGCRVYEYRPFVCRAYGPRVQDNKYGHISLNKDLYPKVWEKYQNHFTKFGAIQPITQGTCSIVKTVIENPAELQKSQDLWSRYGQFIAKHNLYIFRIGVSAQKIMYDFEEELGVELANNWKTPFVSLYFPEGEFRPRENKDLDV